MTTFRDDIRRFFPEIGGEVLPLGIGCATIGGRADSARLAEFQATLSAAYETGVRYIDTSRQYGGSEFRVGEFLKTVARDSVFVATKSPIPDVLTPAEARIHMRQAVDDSLERLGIETIDLYQVHDVSSLENTLAPGGALDALLEARAAGKIRHIGLGVRSHELLATAARHPDFDTTLTYRDYLPVDTSAAGLIADAFAAGKGVINGSPLAFGLLTGENPREKSFHGENEVLRENAARLWELCRRHEVPLLAVALRFPMRNPKIAITLTGPGTPDEWRTTRDALARPIPESLWQET